MTKSEFYLWLDEVIQQPPGTAKAGDVLKDTDYWDSLASFSFSSAADEELGVKVPDADLKQARTVDDLAALLGDKVQS